MYNQIINMIGVKVLNDLEDAFTPISFLAQIKSL